MLKACLLSTSAALALASSSLASGAPRIDQDEQINAILDEGFNHSQVEPTARHLTDYIGSRLTNSPGARAAESWTAAQLNSWGLANVHKEAVPFGRGWSILSSQVAMVSPRPLPLKAIPIAWTPGTDTVLTAPVILAPLANAADLAQWHGKLAGKIVLISPPGTVTELTQPIFRRWTPEELARMGDYHPVPPNSEATRAMIARADFQANLDGYLKNEGALAWAQISREDYKFLHGEGEHYLNGHSATLPAIELAAEDYRRLARLAADGAQPTMSISTQVRYDDSDPNAYNIIADVPGTDPHAGYVMVGAHLDSWHAADGAMDDGAGIVIEMEAARILTRLGIHPRRTIRFALFTGEEQGLTGSRAYVSQHIASRPIDSAPDLNAAQIGARQADSWPLALKPGHNDIKAYFNLDLGSGRIRAVNSLGNAMALPQLRQWSNPFEKMGVTGLGLGNGGGSDATSFLEAGITAVSFTPDYRDILSIHHTDSDTFDHLSMEDLRYNAVIVATLLLEAADADTSLPAMPLPRPTKE
jgi:hypothetical protein